MGLKKPPTFENFRNRSLYKEILLKKETENLTCGQNHRTFDFVLGKKCNYLTSEMTHNDVDIPAIWTRKSMVSKSFAEWKKEVELEHVVI